MKKSLILFSIIFSLISFFSLVSSENLNVSCQTGGPYIKGAVINAIGNVTNVTGTASNVTVKINASTVLATRNTTSDSSGVYQATFTEVIDIGNYTLNATAERSGVYGNCTANLTIVSATAGGVSVNRTIAINGTAVYRDTGRLVASGTAYLSVVGQTVQSTAAIGSNGRFSISIYPLVTLGEKYYLNLVTDDGSGKRSWMQILYVAT